MTSTSLPRSARLFTVLALAACAACGGGSDAKKKNVILITRDTTRADYLSCYGYPDATSPSLDALAEEGTRFEMAVSTAGVTPVSHAAILTGLNNHEHHLRVLGGESGFQLPKDVPTLATVLAEHGYHTLAVHSAFPVSRRFGFKRGFEVFEDLKGEMRKAAGDDAKDTWDVKTLQRRSDATTDVVEKHLGKEPFFLWIHYWDPHDFERSTLPPEELWPPQEELFDENDEPVREPSPMYPTEIKYMDSQIGRLFDWLREKQLWDDTIVIVTADHGQGLGEHDWPAHRLLYQEQIHVPLIAKLPGVAPHPPVKDLVRTIDVFPTVLDYLGIEPPKAVTGRSLRPLIEGKRDEKRIAFGDQINGYDTNAGMTDKRPLDHFLYMAVDWPWKLIYRPLTPDESLLYDLEQDPDEADNLWSTELAARTKLLKELAHAKPWVLGPFAPDGAEADPNAAQALEQLGYTPGMTVDATWEWTCPEHMDQRLGSPGARCPICKEPPIQIAK
jgi:arylsulfatase A-like enzyme